MNVFSAIKLPKVLYETTSQYNGIIQVWETGSTIKLVADGTVQSVNWDSPNAGKMVFGRVVDILKEQEPDLKNILIFGLGGAAMQHLIAKTFPGVSITSVEIDKAMVDVAKNYFRLDEIPNHKVLCADALRVVIEPEKYELTPKSFDAIVVDIYCGDKYPDLGQSGNFLGSMKSLLRPGGLGIFNRIYLDSHQDDVDHFIDDVSTFLKDVETTTIAGKTNSDNILIYGRA